MNSKGYTLLEVSLFLAISGALTLIAIIGLAPRLNNVRFSTGMRAIQDNLSKELLTSELGKNRNTKPYDCNTFVPTADDPDITGGDNGSCVIAGKIAKIKTDRIEYLTIVASSKDTCAVPSSSTFESVIKCYKATILRDDYEKATVYKYPGGITNVSPVGNVGYGYIRSPSDNTIFRFFSINGWNDAGMSLISVLHPITNYSSEDSYPFCFNSGNRTAKITLYKNTSKPNLEFNETCS